MEPCKTKEGERRGQEVGWDLLLGGDLKKLSSRTQGNPLLEGQIGWDRRQSSGPVGG